MKDILSLLKETFAEWSEDRAARLAAALAYYTIFAIAPLLVIVIAAVSLLWDPDQVRNFINSQMTNTLGADQADLISTMIANQQTERGGGLAMLVGIALLIFGATGVFGQLHEALNTIWEVRKEEKGGLIGMLRERFISFTMILGIGFLLLVSLVIDTALSAAGQYAEGILPGAAWLWQVLNLLISFGLITLLFAMIFKILPDVVIQWKDVWWGAAITSLLFVVGRFLLGIYFSKASVGSAYGTAGSLVVILLWVYYSAQILFLGAEFTQVYARRYGSRIIPEEGAVRIVGQHAASQPAELDDEQVERVRRSLPQAQVTQLTPVFPSSPQPDTYPLSASQQQLLPEAKPSVLALSAVVASLVGFLGGMVINSLGGSKKK